jgi:hypothetical protein
MLLKYFFSVISTDPKVSNIPNIRTILKLFFCPKSELFYFLVQWSQGPKDIDISSALIPSLHMSRLRFSYRRSHNRHLQSPMIQTIHLVPGKKDGSDGNQTLDIEPTRQNMSSIIKPLNSPGDGYEPLHPTTETLKYKS